LSVKKRTAPSTIFEVGPRDGLQSEKVFFSIEERRDMVRGLVAAGLQDVEVGSFVREDRIPQLAHSGELLNKLRAEFPKGKKAPRFWAFVPNERGLDEALAAGVDGVSLFTSVSDTFARKNVNRSAGELLEQANVLIRKAKAAQVKHRVYVSTLHHCPFEGPISDAALMAVAKSLKKSGCQEIVLSDTTGHSTPDRIERTLQRVLRIFDRKAVALHLHDTRGLALTNIFAAMKFGITRFDSSFGGLGGCPYAPGASGNLATEDLVYLLDAEKANKDKVDLQRLSEVSGPIENKLGRPLTSKVYRALRGECGIG
jgi:hydroxymethylglutaryl-CoA lyase